MTPSIENLTLVWNMAKTLICDTQFGIANAARIAA